MTQNSAGVCASWGCVVLFTLTLITDSVTTLDSPAPDFSRHKIVLPKVHHGRTKRELSSTKTTDGAHHSELEMRVEVDGEEQVLELRLNHDLIADGHAVRYQKDGKTVLHKPRKEELDLCQYHGTVRGKPSSRVALSTCHGVRGIIIDGEKTKYIEPAKGSDIQSQHYLYDHSDLRTKLHCGYMGGVGSNSSGKVNRFKRGAVDNKVRGPYNENKQSRYVELVLVADNGEFRAAGGDMDIVHRQLKDLANVINAMYSQLNIFIALVGVVVWTERDEIQFQAKAGSTLKNFLHYRRTHLVIDIPNDNAHLLTRHKFEDGIAGLAPKGPMCSWKSSGGLSRNHSKVIGLVATTIAHEMGHNFGMEHDTYDDCECPEKTCIMHTFANLSPHWSSCSVETLDESLERGIDICLRNKPKRLFESSTCGNGFVEPGEQCDCGRVGEGDGNACVACCHPDTCMLRSNATCGAGTCCDLQTCRPKPAGALCRSAERECDLPEYCTGDSEFCPDDVYKMDTTPCGNNEAYCVRGLCRSHADQCHLLWGSSAENGFPICYSDNSKGVQSGNCGFDRLRQVFKPCTVADAVCGRLQCSTYNDLQYGKNSLPEVLTWTITTHLDKFVCRSAIIDVGLSDTDPGLVPDGAKCGPNKMCLSQKCVSVEAVRSSIAVCPYNCSGHGLCNSEGQCHCDTGYAPPLCDTPGVGGSYNSGPAGDATRQHNFMVTMYIIFLGIIPSFTLILLLIYYARCNGIFLSTTPLSSGLSFFNCSSTAHKDYFSNKFSKFQNSTSSLRKLLSFKSKRTIDEIQPSLKTPEMKPVGNIKQPQLATKNPEKPLRKFPPNLTKEDIQIVSGDVSMVKPRRPMPLPKPKVIVKQGLVSTTNELVGKQNMNILIQNRRLGNVSEQHIKVHSFIK